MYNYSNLTKEDWDSFVQQHLNNIFFKRAVLGSEFAPPEILDTICEKQVLFGDCNIMALRNPSISVETKMNYIVPNLNKKDFIRFYNETLSAGNNRRVDMALIDAIIDNDSLDNEIRTNAYRLIDTTSDVYCYIENREFNKLYPQESIDEILAIIVNNEKLFVKDRVAAFNEGCDPELIETPPQELISEILKQSFITYDDYNINNEAVMLANDIIIRMLNYGIESQEDLIAIANECLANDTALSLKNADSNIFIFVKVVEQLRDAFLVNQIASNKHLDYTSLYLAIIQHPEFNHCSFNDKIVGMVEKLDEFYGNKSYMLSVLGELIRHSKLSDEQYDILLNTPFKDNIKDFVLQSYYTPKHIIEKICNQTDPKDFFIIPLELNKNKDKIFPTVYYTIMSFLFNSTNENKLRDIDINEKLTTKAINFSQYYDILNRSERNNSFDEQYSMTLNNPACYKNLLEVLNSIFDKTDKSYPFVEKLKFVKHHFEASSNVKDFCTKSIASNFFLPNPKVPPTVNYKNLHLADESCIKSSLSKLNEDELRFFKKQLLIAFFNFDSQEQTMLSTLNDNVIKLCDNILKEKEKNPPTLSLEHKKENVIGENDNCL
jgi:hypothetical protein